MLDLKTFAQFQFIVDIPGDYLINFKHKNTQPSRGLLRKTLKIVTENILFTSLLDFNLKIFGSKTKIISE